MKPKAPVLWGLVALPLAVIGIFLTLRDSTPGLDVKACTEARATWSQRGIADYTVTVLKEADTLGSERFVTEVKDGRATAVTLDGAPLSATDTYSVTGLFDTIERELEMAASAVKEPGQPKDTLLKARFHDKLGLPLVFKRLTPNGQSFLLSIEEFRADGRGVLYTH